MNFELKIKPKRLVSSFFDLFDAQDARNSISELPDFKIFLGSMPQTPIGEGALEPPIYIVAYSSLTSAYFKFKRNPAVFNISAL